MSLVPANKLSLQYINQSIGIELLPSCCLENFGSLSNFPAGHFAPPLWTPMVLTYNEFKLFSWCAERNNQQPLVGFSKLRIAIHSEKQNETRVSIPARLQGYTRIMQDEQGRSDTNRGISSNQPIKRGCKKPIKRADIITLSPSQKKDRVQRPKTNKQSTTTNTELRRIFRLVSEGVTTCGTVHCVQCPSQQLSFAHPHLT